MRPAAGEGIFEEGAGQVPGPGGYVRHEFYVTSEAQGHSRTWSPISRRLRRPWPSGRDLRPWQARPEVSLIPPRRRRGVFEHLGGGIRLVSEVNQPGEREITRKYCSDHQVAVLPRVNSVDRSVRGAELVQHNAFRYLGHGCLSGRHRNASISDGS